MKESLTLAISELQLEKDGKATIDDITQEWANNTLNVYSPILESDENANTKIITMQKEEIVKRYKIKGDLSIEELQSGRINVTYEVGEKIENNVKILIKVEAQDGIREIHTVDSDIIHANGKNEIAIDYIVELNVEYKFTIVSETGEEKEEVIRIYNPKINYSKEEALVLNVEVEYPNMEITNARNEYSLDGINYFVYENPVEVKDDCTFYARTITAENKVVLYIEENIENIIYAWNSWEAKEKFNYIQKETKNYRQMTPIERDTSRNSAYFYSSMSWTETGVKCEGSSILETGGNKERPLIIGKYYQCQWGVLKVGSYSYEANTSLVQGNGAHPYQLVVYGTYYYKEKVSDGFEKGENFLGIVYGANFDSYPDSQEKGGIWYESIPK